MNVVSYEQTSQKIETLNGEPCLSCVAWKAKKGTPKPLHYNYFN